MLLYSRIEGVLIQCKNARTAKQSLGYGHLGNVLSCNHFCLGWIFCCKKCWFIVVVISVPRVVGCYFLLQADRVKVSTSCGFCASMPLLCLFSCYMSSACEVHSEVHTLCRIEVVLNKTDFMSPQKHLTRHLKVFCKHAGSDDSLVWLRGEVLLVPEWPYKQWMPSFVTSALA